MPFFEPRRPSSERWFLVAVGFAGVIAGGVLLAASARPVSTWWQATLIEFAGAMVMVGLFELLFNLLVMTFHARPAVVAAAVWLLLGTGVTLLVIAYTRESGWAQAAMIEMGSALAAFALLEVRLVIRARTLEFHEDMMRELTDKVALAAARREGLNDAEINHLVVTIRRMDLVAIPVEQLPALVGREAARIRRERGLFVVDQQWPTVSTRQRIAIQQGVVLLLFGIGVLFAARYLSGWSQGVAIEMGGVLVLVGTLDLMLSGLVPEWSRPFRTLCTLTLVLVVPGILLIVAARSRAEGWGQSMMLEFGAGFVAFVVLVYIIQFVRSVFAQFDQGMFAIAVARAAGRAEGLNESEISRLIGSLAQTRMGPTATQADMVSHIRGRAAAIRKARELAGT